MKLVLLDYRDLIITLFEISNQFLNFFMQKSDLNFNHKQLIESNVMNYQSYNISILISKCIT